MKILGSLFIIVVLVLGMGILVTQHYQNYRHAMATEKANVFAAHVQEVEKIKTDEAAKYAALQQKYDALATECEKGRAIYETLTTSAKARTQAPVCTTP